MTIPGIEAFAFAPSAGTLQKNHDEPEQRGDNILARHYEWLYQIVYVSTISLSVSTRTE